MSELMTKAVELMVVGMGFVFAFLALLVVATGFMSRMTMRYAAPEQAVAPRRSASAAKPVIGTAARLDPQTAEAIKIAIDRYRSHHKQ